MKRFYGVYRATVVGNIDPMRLARLSVLAPDVKAATPSWAMPSAPMAGKQAGAFLLPQVGASVWVQFEAGDPDRPVWTGGFWGNAADVPTLALQGTPADPPIVLQTPLQNAIAINDAPGPSGGILLKSTSGATIVVNDTGIYIQNGKGASIVLEGPAVTVNDGALVVV